ncbi:6605_t:CDS:1, partial [Cetraspora pellucida]
IIQKVEIINEEILQIEVVENEVIREIPIKQKEYAKLKYKRSLYTGISRMTIWRKKQKADTLLNIEASSDLSHLFPAVNIIKRLQLLQPLSATLLANTLSLVS